MRFVKRLANSILTYVPSIIHICLNTIKLIIFCFFCRIIYYKLISNWWALVIDIYSIHHMMKITKLLGYKTLRCTNKITSWIERWTRAYVSDSQYACEKLCQWVASPTMAIKIVHIYLLLWEKKAQISIHRLDWNQM